MKVSISNIAWEKKNDLPIYQFMKAINVDGLEIAPSLFVGDNPYNNIEYAKKKAYELKNEFGVSIVSMQSIWYGIDDLVFGSECERKKLIEYTKQAINFSSSIGCPNLVFGCPRNRNIPHGLTTDANNIAYDFFSEIGFFASDNDVYIAIEPNPVIYNTNFLNTTNEVFDFCKKLNNPGIKANVDFGTIIYNKENLDDIKNNMSLVNHVHISEPNLKPIQSRKEHATLISLLKEFKYNGYISIEMANTNSIQLVKDTILYLKGLDK